MATIDRVNDYVIVQGRHGDPELHHAGCPDLDRARTDVRITYRASTQGEAAADFWSDFDMDEAEALGATRVMPCADRH